MGVGRVLYVHRLVYAAIYNVPVDGLVVCHRCDNPPCFRPDHLFIGTQAQNLADMRAKGRQARGERIGTAKLTEADVREIRSRYPGETQAALGREFGVAPQTIGKVVLGRRWAHAC